jgi:hypothetical protein
MVPIRPGRSSNKPSHARADRSAMEPENIHLIHADIEYQVDAGFSQIMLWSDLQKIAFIQPEDVTTIVGATVGPKRPTHPRPIFPGISGADPGQPRPQPIQLGVNATTTGRAPDRRRGPSCCRFLPNHTVVRPTKIAIIQPEDVTTISLVPRKDRRGRRILDLSFPVYLERTRANPGCKQSNWE